MRDSQLDVEQNVNFLLVDSDGRSINDRLMSDQDARTPYQYRFDAMVMHLGLRNRAEFGRKMGVSAQVLSNWYKRDQRIPDKERRRLADLGISLDWLNEADGPMEISSTSEISQLARPDPSMIQEAATAFGNAFRSGVRDRPLDLENREDAEAFARALARNLQIREDMRRHESTVGDGAQGDEQAGSGSTDSLGHDGPAAARKVKQRRK